MAACNDCGVITEVIALFALLGAPTAARIAIAADSDTLAVLADKPELAADLKVMSALEWLTTSAWMAAGLMLAIGGNEEKSPFALLWALGLVAHTGALLLRMRPTHCST